MKLARYAISKTIGREYCEPAPFDRNDFQRDRDRIVHSSAFRRLEYKTQVFVNHEGDLYRTRLTHSIEVAQIARSIARYLGLNEDLTEAIALAHDLGHTPFGHSGQEMLNRCMKDFGGFEHNLQSLRIVQKLEEHYAEFRGLNLCFETREGILKHCSKANAKKLGAIGQNFLLNKSLSLEAQLVDLADSLAYNNHDIDDGLRSKLLSLDLMLEDELFYDCFTAIKRKHPKTNTRILIHETIRKMIKLQIRDLITNSKINLANLTNPQEVKHRASLIKFSSSMQQSHLNLKKLLRNNLYNHPKIKSMSEQAKNIINNLFSHFMTNPELIPSMNHKVLDLNNQQEVARATADYIAGMTDRFALKTNNLIGWSLQT